MLNALSRFLPKAGTAAVVAGVWALLAVSPARATVTIEFYFEDETLADGAVAVLVADANGDGFLPPSNPAVLQTVLAEGELIGGSDDVVVAVLQADRGPEWNGSAGIATTIERLHYADFGITAGTPLILYVFPDITQPGAAVVPGDKVLSYRNDEPGGSGGDIGFEAPADPGYHTISALTAAQGGAYDPQNPAPGESSATVNAGLPGSDGTGDSRADATTLTSGVPAPGSLTAGALDFYKIQIDGLSRIVARTTGGSDTVGALFGPGGTLLNDPAVDDGAPDFLIDAIVDATGELSLAIRGKGDNQTGDYEVVLEVIPLAGSRPDLTIGKTLGAQRGDGLVNSSGAGQKITLITKGRKGVRFFFKLQNDGDVAAVISLTGTPKGRKSNLVYFKISNGLTNVTAAMKRTGFRANLDPMQEETFKLIVKPNRRTGKANKPTHRAGKPKKARKKILINAVSVTGAKDTVRAVVKKK